MKKIILVAHGNFAKAAKETTEMIMGEQEAIETISFQIEDGLKTLVDKIQSIINSSESCEWLIIADLFGGTPFNAGSSIAMMNPDKEIKVISGLSIPILLEIISNLENSTLSDLVTTVIDGSKEIVREFVMLDEEEDLL